MIPSTINQLLNSNLEFQEQPSRNYKMHFEERVVSGYRDSIETMRQVIFKILNTERYQYVIYSWNYGIELLDLFGEPVSFVCPELERRITEALLQDDRVEAVNSFVFSFPQKGTILVTFTVHTTFGDIDAERMVKY